MGVCSRTHACLHGTVQYECMIYTAFVSGTWVLRGKGSGPGRRPTICMPCIMYHMPVALINEDAVLHVWQIFYFFGMCDTTASAAACSNDYYAFFGTTSPSAVVLPSMSACNTNCFLDE